jgi:hypothetical protein
MTVTTIAAILCIALAGFFKAVCDTLDDHYDISIFKWKDPRWWNPNVSCNHVGFLKFTKYRPDAWHLSHSFMVLAFVCSILLYRNHIHLVNGTVSFLIELVVAGISYNGTFNTFYNRILINKKVSNGNTK